MDSMHQVLHDFPSLLNGALTTIEVTFFSLIFATILGLIFGMFRISQSKILKYIAKIYISVIRGTPLYVQIFFFHFGLFPLLFGHMIDANISGIFVLSLNAGAYLVEIFRAGIESIDKGQMEAGRAIGFSHGQTMRYIILPQAIKRMIPAFLNQFIISLKDTSLLAAIGVGELMYSAQTIYSMNYLAFQYLSAIAIMYWIIITLLTWITSILERRLSRS